MFLNNVHLLCLAFNKEEGLFALDLLVTAHILSLSARVTESLYRTLETIHCTSHTTWPYLTPIESVLSLLSFIAPSGTFRLHASGSGGSTTWNARSVSMISTSPGIISFHWVFGWFTCLVLSTSSICLCGPSLPWPLPFLDELAFMGLASKSFHQTCILVNQEMRYHNLEVLLSRRPGFFLVCLFLITIMRRKLMVMSGSLMRGWVKFLLGGWRLATIINDHLTLLPMEEVCSCRSTFKRHCTWDNRTHCLVERPSVRLLHILGHFISKNQSLSESSNDNHCKPNDLGLSDSYMLTWAKAQMSSLIKKMCTPL